MKYNIGNFISCCCATLLLF
uniref:Uncharacterized protein n=1 Tax=Anguilla anguilla TaxID=7936 RepID=A0A0E9PSZ4_ANGAN